MTVEYNNKHYPAKFIEDKDFPNAHLLIVSDTILDDIVENDEIKRDAVELDNSIFFYANEEEFKMNDEELFNHIINIQ